MPNESEMQRPAPEQIRDARDLLTRLYREIGISAVAAALAAGRTDSHPARPAIDLLKAAHAPHTVDNSAREHTRAA